MTYLFMVLFIVVFAVCLLWGITYNRDKQIFFDVDDVKVLRGFWCIVVILVHIPVLYQNHIQDMVGSFAYIGVTFFFMTSAYGLKYGIRTKKNYLQDFWSKRILQLFIPALFVSILENCFDLFRKKEVGILTVMNIDNWVKLLLVYNVLFWLVYIIPSKRFKECWRDILICFFVLAMSLIDKLTEWKITFIWPTESIGFVYGIILANVYNTYKNWCNRNWCVKTIFLFVASGIMGIVYLKYKSFYFIGDYCLKIILGMILLMFIMQIIRRFQLGNKAILFLGGISYEIYLLHRMILDLMADNKYISNSGMFIIVSILIIILSATITQKLLKSGLRLKYINKK